MTTHLTPARVKPPSRKRTRAAADDDAAATNPDILCHQIGRCRNLAELQAFIARHSLLNVGTDERFSPRMKIIIEAALDTMTEVLQAPDGADLAALFTVPADLAAKGWSLEREGVLFTLRKGQLSTSGYVVIDQAFEAARKLGRREGNRRSSPGTSSPEAAGVDEVVVTAASGDDSGVSTIGEAGEAPASAAHAPDGDVVGGASANDPAPSGRYTVTRRFTQPLRVRLTPVEIAAKCDALDKALSHKEQLEQRFEAVKKTFKADIETAGAVVTEVEKVLRRKSEEREGECEERLYAREACEVRLDTGEVIKRRALKPEERQDRLPSI